MKKIVFSIFLCWLFAIYSGFGQLGANAGPNKVVCIGFNGFEPVILGSNPTATGGTPPYTFTWDALFIYTIGSNTYTFNASFFLDDTTLANPTISDYLYVDDWIEFHLTVTDSENNVCRDTTLIRYSSYIMLLGYIMIDITQGDSIYLCYGLNLSGGIPPYQYLWRPNHGLKDSTSLSFWAKPDYSIAYYAIVTDSAGCSEQSPPFYFVNVHPVLIEDKIEAETSFRIFPNPCDDFIIFKFNNESSGKKSIEIFDAHNRLLWKEMNIHGETRISTNNLPAGLYFYKVYESDFLKFSGKFIVQR